MKPVAQRHHTPRRYRVSHVTRYDYSEDVTASYGRACLRPRATPEQTILGHDIRITPTPGVLSEHVDLFGNFSHYLEVLVPHRRFEVAKTTVVDVARPAPDLAALDRWTLGSAAAQPDGAEPLLRAAYLLPSPLARPTAPVRDYAAGVLAPGAGLGEALAGLVTAIHRDFPYRKGVTTVRTTAEQLLDAGGGVCQDFAHLALACLRSAGLPARYVSGYLETQPPPGRPKLTGADASHAWVSVRVPDGHWLDLDPTNDCVADSRYVVTAWGRDYLDVSPLKGVIFTEGASSSLDVSVDVHRLTDLPETEGAP